MAKPYYLLLASSIRERDPWYGYTGLAKGMTNARLLTVRREEPRTLARRVLTRALSSFAACRWYRPTSLTLERSAVRHLTARSTGLVHFLWGDSDWGYLDWLTRWLGVPLCVTFHGCPDTLPQIVRSGMRLRGLSAIVLMSEIQRSFFEAQGVSAERIHVIHHGIDCEFFRPAATPPNGSTFNVLSVGTYRRNFELLRDAWRHLATNPDLRLTVIAPEQHKPTFDGLPNVEFMSGLSAERLRDEYQRASCLLVTLENSTANNAILEAMACGVPVVAEDIGGVAEYSRDCAILCKPRDVNALVSGVRALVNDPELVRGMSRRARLRAEELDWTIVRARTVQLYDALMAAHDGGST